MERDVDLKEEKRRVREDAVRFSDINYLRPEKKNVFPVSSNVIGLTSIHRRVTRPTVTNDMAGIWHENQ